MVGVNKVILIGNLGKNPDVVAFPQDRHNEAASVVKKASFPLATTEYRKTRDGERVEQTEWHNVVCWRALAEIAEKILHKGTQLYVEGKLQTRSWEDREGVKRYITEVVADNFTVLANKNRPDEAADKEQDPLSTILNSETEPLGDLPF
ncbi:MAG: single-stranded DNA-binding protein [Bacteroidales bacterium]|jgi:single-strand DNA-binding protein|nr:single-stranded DNA-binding protein [Bacteroidales bacterium]MBR6991870.1 single-stranded DNA-binding protein [Bacteroidales bacterium]